MPYKVNVIIHATECRIRFEQEGRLVFLEFEAPYGLSKIQIPESVMANITGQFLRERLFGLH